MKILIAIDFDEISAQVESIGFDLAKKLNAHVDLVNIVDKNINYMPVYVPMDFADAWQAQCHKAERNLEKVHRDHIEVASEIIALIGDPKEDIINKAIERNANMIIIGTHGRTGIKNLVMGSTAEYIVRHSTVPVLIIPYNPKRH